MGREIVSKGIGIIQKDGVRHFSQAFRRFIGRNINKILAERAFRLYYPAAKKWYLFFWNFDTDNWEAPLDPFKIVWVSPNEITEFTGRRPNLPREKRVKMFGTVRDGDWDITDEVVYHPYRPETYGDNQWLYKLLMEKKFEETIFFQSAKNHFQSGIPWEDTEFYKEVVNALDKGKDGLPSYATNQDNFKRNLDKIDGLYKSVRENGVVPQHSYKKRSFLRTSHASILVDISRNGDFLFVEGRRRLTVAKLLDIELIPVRIQVRHPKWMNYRDKVFRNEVDDNHLDFIDFQQEGPSRQPFNYS